MQEGTDLTGQAGGEEAQKPVCGNDGHLTPCVLQVLVQLGCFYGCQLLQHSATSLWPHLITQHASHS